MRRTQQPTKPNLLRFFDNKVEEKYIKGITTQDGYFS